MSTSPIEPHLRELITTYNELNSCTIQELHSEPSPLEFMRFVARNTPFVVRKAAAHWKAVQTWSPSVLLDILGDQHVNVAVTPNGYADAPTQMPDGVTVLAQPHEESQSFREFLGYLMEQKSNRSSAGGRSEVRYAQTQNDNLRDEYLQVYSHVQQDIPFARIALDRNPDAINMWIGNNHSVTSMHRDNYENIYVQIRGRKHFWLLPALCQPCVNEQLLPGATYSRNQDGGISLLVDKTGATTPFPTWDPENGSRNATIYSELAQPIRATLEPGDMLYLPAMWYHKVAQSCDEGGIVVAVNYWYDMDFDGPLYPLCSMVRNMTRHSKNPPRTTDRDRKVKEGIDDTAQREH